MKKILLTAAMCFGLSSWTSAIELDFSYFFPFGGSFASPIAPIGFDDIGLTFGDYFGISTGLLLYNVGGMAVKGIPDLTVKGAATGPFTSLNIPLYAKFILPVEFVKLEIKGGGFLFYNFGIELNKNFDSGLASLLNYDTLVSSFQIDNNIGIGWRIGAEITFYVTKNIGIVLGANYLSGFSMLNIRGQYTATKGSAVTPGNVNYTGAYLDYTGLVIALGGEYIFQ